MVRRSSAERGILFNFRAFLIVEGIEIYRDQISVTSLDTIDECMEVVSAVIEEAAVSGSTATIILTVAQPPQHLQSQQLVETRCGHAELDKAGSSSDNPAPDNASSEATSISEQLSQLSLLSTQPGADHA